ncbi:tetratricopeptide repeat protein [Spiractinospora alimapuensis]|uniref:tetratricopeptide repeat protein n=1 Tax=Spiractinospora alimapuensis TaxID=2820884 RepID=UPI001F2BE4E4|nr:tetratricopeptide repeat protein [Spiractinospora alimapuensis]QVQ52969.1 tetratricopeptide repeat protein [Spiractinospora alimapuensis]
MTATVGGPAHGAGEEPGGETAGDLCDQARDLANGGHLKRAARLYEKAARHDGGAGQARALFGLAVVRFDLGDVEGAREADTRAIETGHREYAPRAAHHLALCREETEDPEGARVAWRTVLELGNERYLAAAHHGLARLAESEGDLAEAARHWEGVERHADADPDTAVTAAADHGRRLLARGDTEGAARQVKRGRAQETQGRDASLGLVSAAVHLERAIVELGGVLDDEERDPEATRLQAPEDRAAIVELLARLLALRGDPGAAREVWTRGVEHRDVELAAGVQDRLRRGFLTPELAAPDDGTEPDAAAEPWWDGYVAAAVADDSLPLLTGELFLALTQMHAHLGSVHAAGSATPVDALWAAVLSGLRVPSDYAWGASLHADFADRLSQASGGHAVLPENWPDEP